MAGLLERKRIAFGATHRLEKFYFFFPEEENLGAIMKECPKDTNIFSGIWCDWKYKRLSHFGGDEVKWITWPSLGDVTSYEVAVSPSAS